MSNIACVNQRYLCEIDNLQTKAKCLEQQVTRAYLLLSQNNVLLHFLIFEFQCLVIHIFGGRGGKEIPSERKPIRTNSQNIGQRQSIQSIDNCRVWVGLINA